MRLSRALLTFSVVASAFLTDVHPSAAAAALSPSSVLKVDGHGWGHGYGMGQYGAIGYAKQGKTWEQILSTYYPGTTLSDRSAETIRVHLRDAPVAVVTSRSHPFAVYWQGSTTKVAESSAQYPFLRASVSGSQITISRSSSTGGPWTSIASSSHAAIFHPGHDVLGLLSTSSQAVRYYRGLVEVLLPQGASQAVVVNELGMEPYLDGVVPREMSGDWPADAVRAQAVAARSYSAARKDSARKAGKLYDICATDRCQVYGGYAKASSPSASPTVIEEQGANDAVQFTQGKILTYNGAVIEAEYSSSSGGYTAAGSVPWEKAVVDAGDSFSPFHNWSDTVSVSSINNAWPSIGSLISIKVTKRNGYGDWGGRVVHMDLVGTSGTLTISGGEFRSAMGLRSDWFFVHVPASWVAREANVLVNGSFESGWSGWKQIGNHAASDGPTSSVARDGSRAMVLVAGGSKAITQSVSIVGASGRRFVLSGWARTSGTDSHGGMVALSLNFRNSDGSSSTSSIEWSRSAHDWQYIEKTIVAPKPFSSGSVTITFNDQSGSAIFDALSLSDNMVANPSFELGANGWSGSSTTSSDGPTSNVFKDGSQSMTLSAGTKSFTQRIGEPGPAGRRYELGAWTKGDGTSASGSTALVATFNNSDGSQSVTTLQGTAGPHGWEYIDGEISAPKAFRSIDLAIAVSHQTGNTFFDSVSMKQNRLTNGSFEHGTTSWSVVGSNVGATTSPARQGSGSLRIAAGSGSRGVFVKLNAPGSAGHPVFIEGWSKTTGNSNAHATRLSVGFSNKDGTTTWRNLYFPAPAHDWTHAEMAGVPDKQYTSMKIYALSDAGSSDAFFDGLAVWPA